MKKSRTLPALLVAGAYACDDAVPVRHGLRRIPGARVRKRI